ncbi:MAG: MoaD/ThiS family protein [Methanobrevibacter sp. CfCl-M3]
MSFNQAQNQVVVGINGTTIQDAVNAAPDGGTVIIPEGTYKGEMNKNIRVIKNLTIKGEGNAIIDAEDYGRAFNIEGTSGARKVNIIGLTIWNTKSTANYEYGGSIYFQTSSTERSTLVDCKFKNSYGFEGGAVYCLGNIAVKDCSFTNTRSVGTNGGAIYFYNSGSAEDCNFTDTHAGLAGGSIYNFNGGLNIRNCNFKDTSSSTMGGAIYSGMNVNDVTNYIVNCNITNTQSGDNGGALCFSSSYIENNVVACNIVNCTSPTGGAGIFAVGSGSKYMFNRFVNNTLTNGTLDNIYADNSNNNYDNNWWGSNDINKAGIHILGGALPNNYYQLMLTVDNEYTRDINKSVGSFFSPIPLGYRMVSNGTNNILNTYKLPDFDATLTLSGNNGLFGAHTPFRMTPGSSINVLAKNSWMDTMTTVGDYVFSVLVDNQQLNISFTADKVNTILSVDADNIIYGDNTNIKATLTSVNGTLLSNKNIIFTMNGLDYIVTTDANGVAVLNINGLDAGSYNVDVSFNEDDIYKSSINSVSFNIDKRGTILNLTASDIVQGNDTNITAILTDNNGLPLSNKAIMFKLNGTAHTVTTDEFGVAVLNVGGLDVGNYSVDAMFSGDIDYNSANKITNFSVTSPGPDPNPGPTPDNNDTNNTNDTIDGTNGTNDGTNGTNGTNDINNGFHNWDLPVTGLPLLLVILACIAFLFCLIKINL